MTPKEAIEAAKQYVRDVFASEGAINIGLEELRYDDPRDVWVVTIGFSRDWDRPKTLSRLTIEQPPLPRTFKTVEISDADGKVVGMTHWPIAA